MKGFKRFHKNKKTKIKKTSIQTWHFIVKIEKNLCVN